MAGGNGAKARAPSAPGPRGQYERVAATALALLVSPDRLAVKR
ncbi:hypothetical protein M2437_000275 [Methylorubrum pseudosasae]|nr:hypothetical protein [Methylorubrum pseudosasae]